MKTYAVLLRGINVGGKNKLSMTALKKFLEDMGFSGVTTYIASGNVILKSGDSPSRIAASIEEALPRQFKLDSEIIKVLVLSDADLHAVIGNKPAGFGEQPDKYHSDAIFLIGLNTADALKVFKPREGVDTIWPSDGVIYSQRLSSQRTQSRLGKIIGTTAYKSMTIRNWNTVQKLAAMMKNM